MKNVFLLFVLLILLSFSKQSHAQYLNGKVTAESGFGASNVTVNFLNKSNSIVTNADGTFKILASHLPDTLVFSAPGFETYKVPITKENMDDPSFEVVLLNKRNTLTATEPLGRGMMTARDEVYASREKDVSEKKMLRGVKYDKKVRVDKTMPVSAAPVAYTRSGTYLSTDAAGRKLANIADPGDLKDTAVTENQLLTAGEINDFYKWKMWGDLNEHIFKNYCSEWGIYATHRYTVQLQNSRFDAIINKPVHLVKRSTREKIWTAITDNTGKAELWAGFTGVEPHAPQELMITDGEGHEITNPVSFDRGVNHLQTDADCGASSKVDIAFVVDATGSMGDEIEFLKFGLEDVIRNSYSRYSNLDLKVGSVFYRDMGDEYVTRHIDFQSDLLKVLNFVKLQKDGGGGDMPEAVDSALDVALNQLSWRADARTRLLFLVLDAPPHAEKKNAIRELIKKAAAMGIRIIPVACSGSTQDNEFLLRTMALATNGTYTFLTDKSGVGNKHLAPTTDSYTVEYLNTLLKKIINQFVFVKDCNSVQQPETKVPVERQPENILKVKIFPNPTKGNITIESNVQLKEVYVADFTGKLLVRLQQSKSGNWSVNIGNYPSGTYLVKYITNDNRWGAEKVVLIH